MAPILPARPAAYAVGEGVPVGVCRACRARRTPDDGVLDLGAVPAADDFPRPTDPVPDAVHPLSMWLCRGCGLAQLTADDTSTAEPLAVEPQALRDQAADAVARVHTWSGRPATGTVTELGSPHGGSWLGLFAERGWTEAPDSPADVVVDTFGLMHEPDVAAALAHRAERLAEGGVLLLLFHSLEAILTGRQWSALRHGHFGYFSLSALRPALVAAGLAPAHAWEFGLYGGTVLLAATRGEAGGETGPDATVTTILGREEALGLTRPEAVRALQDAADGETEALRAVLAGVDPAHPWYAYGAASRAVAVLHRAGATPERIAAVADASPGKQGHAMPGSRIPIVSPEDLVAADPERVWLLLPDLLPEVSAAYPALAGRWQSPAGGIA